MAEEPLNKNTEVEATIPLPGKISVVPNWRKVLKTYSFWINVSSVVLTFITVILPYVGFLQPVLTVGQYGWMMFILNASAALARMIKQRKFWDGDVPKETGDGNSPS